MGLPAESSHEVLSVGELTHRIKQSLEELRYLFGPFLKTVCPPEKPLSS